MKRTTTTGLILVMVFTVMLSELMILPVWAQDLPAFPGAEGYGSDTPGGRGGRVIEVTNLNDSGPGSLRAAVEAKGPRIVVFRVSGTIALKSDLSVRNPYLTIAGQTAPGDGICLRNRKLIIRTNDVIVRYLRIRVGREGRGNDALAIDEGTNVIIDHCSLSWGCDETLNTWHGAKNITVQWCIVSEGLHHKGHGFAASLGGENASYHHLLIAHCPGRNPSIGGNNEHQTINMDFRNSVIYNFGHRTFDGKPTSVNIVNNYFKPGPNSTEKDFAKIDEVGAYEKIPSTAWYVSGNVWEGNEAITKNNAAGVSGATQWLVDTPAPFAPVRTVSTQEAYDMVLADVGATLPKRDPVDTRIIKDVRTGTATFGKGVVLHQDDVGGWPELESAPAPADSDQDGMPDAWEKDRGLNPDDASDGSQDRNGDGYTNVEEYINGLVTAGVYRASAKPSSKKAIVLEEYVFLKRPTRDCHSSTLLELANGDLLCTWFGGTRENHPDVNIWLARKPKGGQWQAPMSVSDGGGKTCFNPVLVQLKGGDIQIYYCSPNIDTGQVITSSDNSHTWSEPRQLPEGFVGPIVNKPVYMDDGTIIAGSSLQGKPGKRIHVERSTDNGKTWTKIGPISDPVNTEYEIIQPTILVHSQKRLQILARTNKKDKDAKLAQTWSEDGGLTWSPVTDATLPNNNSAIDAVTLDDGRHLLVYNHSTRQDPIGGRKGRGILTVAVTKDGINWEAAAVLEYRTGSVQYSYPSMIQTKDGLVHVSYSWHRKRIKHVVLDPKKLETYPIVDGQWPKDKMPWVQSEDLTEVNQPTEVLK